MSEVRVVRTVFTREEAAAAARTGLQIVRLSPRHVSGDVVRDRETGECCVLGQRLPAPLPNPRYMHVESPAPAYLFPPDLQEGERVYLPQLIGVASLRDGHAIWRRGRLHLENRWRRQWRAWWEAQRYLGPSP